MSSTLDNAKVVIRDVVIINLLPIFIAVSLSFFIKDVDKDTHIIIVSTIANIVGMPLGFFIVGCLVKINRLKHLLSLAFLIWILSIPNIYLFPHLFTKQSWAFSIVPILMFMIIGGSFSLCFVPYQKINNKNKITDFIVNKIWQILCGLPVTLLTGFISKAITQ